MTGMTASSSPRRPRWLQRSRHRRTPARPAAPQQGHPLSAHLVARWGRVLLGGQGDSRAVPEADLPALGRGHRERPAGRAGHHRQQPPVLRRSLLRAAAAAAQGHLPGQVRVLHRARPQGPGQQGVLQRRGADPGGPGRRPGRRARAEHRAAGAGPGQAARHLPGGHQDPGRAALPGQDRGGPAGPGVRRAGHPVRHVQHLRADAGGEDSCPGCVSGPASGTASRWTSPATPGSNRTGWCCAR